MTEQKRIRDFLREGTAVDVDQRTRTRTALVYMSGEELFAGSRCAYQKDRQGRRRESLHQLGRTPDRQRATDDRRYSATTHCSTLRCNRGIVTLSASASVLRIRGVRNRYSSVRLNFRSAWPRVRRGWGCWTRSARHPACDPSPGHAG